MALTMTSSGRERSNRKMISNAISYVCLAGGALEQERLQAQRCLADSPGMDCGRSACHDGSDACLVRSAVITASQFVILVRRDRNLLFKGLYALDLVCIACSVVVARGAVFPSILNLSRSCVDSCRTVVAPPRSLERAPV